MDLCHNMYNYEHIYVLIKCAPIAEQTIYEQQEPMNAQCGILDSPSMHKMLDCYSVCFVNSLRPRDAYMRRWTNHHWFR